MLKGQRSIQARDLPGPIHELLIALDQHELEGILVGGVTRDFLLEGVWGSDIDLEIRARSKTPFLTTLDKILGELALRHQGSVEILNFEVRRLTYKDLVFELAPVRFEIYPDHSNPTGHSDFEVTFPWFCSDHEAFARRDFTLNAIGLSLDSKNAHDLVWRDPFNGIAHLQSGLLECVHPEFDRDPVRFFRAFRFQRRFDYQWSTTLENSLKNFDLSKAKAREFFKELLKLGETSLLISCATFWVDHKIPLSDELKRWSFLALLGQHSDTPEKFDDPLGLVLNLFMGPAAADLLGPSSADFEDRIADLKLKKKEVMKYLNCIQLLQSPYFKDELSFDELLRELAQHSLEALAQKVPCLELVRALDALEDHLLRSRLMGFSSLKRAIVMLDRLSLKAGEIELNEAQLMSLKAQLRRFQKLFMVLQEWRKK
jgi:hypothetical protein